MREILDRYISQFHRDHQKRRKAIALFVVLSLLVSGSVTWRLKSDGIAMTNEAFCGKEEHQHSEACYTKVLTCGKEETEGHHHSKEAGCYEEQKTLVCAEKEHTHGDGCYDEEGNLICTEPEHTHSDSCYETKEVLVCDKPESEGHTHSESCYTKELTCGKEEHVHTAACYSNNQADVETADDWEKTIPSGLGSSWAENVVKVAASQLGYAESTKNYQLSEQDGTSHKGYTRYGAWYGNDYGDWSAMFVSFCLKYAGVPENTVPYASGAYAWETALKEKGLYQEKTYAAKAGDIIFLDKDQDGKADCVGIVESVSEDGKQIKTIEGDCAKDGADVVAEMTYAGDDAKIVGYGKMAENPEETADDQTESEPDGETEEQPDVIAESENAGEDEEQTSAETKKEAAVQSGDDNEGEAVTLSGDEDLGYDFTGDIIYASVSVKKNGNWVPTTEVEDGEGIKVDLSYLLPKNTLSADEKRIHYQLPKGIKPLQEESGAVDQNGKPVGTYKITTDGLVLIEFNDNFADGEAFSGSITFQGKASLSDLGKPGDIDFGGKGGTITIKEKNDTAEYDIKTAKTASLSADGTKVSYEIVTSTTKGTEGTVTIQDKFQQASASGKYDRDSVKICKVGKDGTKQELTEYTPAYTTENGREGFSIKDLPKLEAGEQYIVSYDAEVTPENKDGSGTVKNAAGSSSKGKEEWKWVDTEVAKSMISKSGYYNSDKNTIQWTINLNQGKKDLEGWKLDDQLQTGDTSVKLPSTVTIKGADGKTKEISLPHTFTKDDGLDLNQSFTVTYETENPSDGKKYENQATIEKDGKKYESNKIGVDVKYRTWDLKKSGPSMDGKTQDGKQTYLWDAEVVIPVNADYDQFLYTDEIKDALNTADGTILNDSHYALASQLNEKFTTGNGLILRDADGRSLNDKVEFVITYYNKDGNKVSASDSSTKVKKFTIKIQPKEGESIDAVKLIISRYPTLVDYSGMNIGETWSFKNTAKIPDHESSKDGTYTKPNPISKKVFGKNQWNNREYLKDSGNLSYTEDNGILKYRVKWNNETGTNEELIFVDILPAGCTLVDGTVKGHFYGNDSWCYDEKGEYHFDGAQKVEVETEPQAEGTTKVTFKIKSGYNVDQSNASLLVDYEVKIDWTDPRVESKVFTNKISWGDYSDEQTTTVTKNVDKASKTAKQITETDANGKTIYTNVVEYAVTINPAAQDLNPNTDRLEMADTLQMDSGVEAYLDLTNTKLYAYDPAQENGRGQEIDPARYQISYNQKTHKMIVNLPDELACVLVYRYSVDYGNVAEPTLKNSVNLNGNWPATNAFKMEVLSSSASVVKGKLTIYKVDSKDYTKKLEGAVFKLEKWDTTKKEWTAVNTDNTVTNGEYTTNENGELIFTSALETTPLRTNTLYRLTEETAPTGYQKKADPEYFVLMKPLSGYDPGDRTQTIKELALRDTKDAFDAARVSQNDASFFDAEKEVMIYVPNEYSSLNVKKVWTDADGGTLNSHPKSVKVQLYKQKTKLDSCVVTVTVDFNINGGEKRQSSIEIKKGSSVTIICSGIWNGGSITGFDNIGSGQVKKVIKNVNEDMTVEAKCTLSYVPGDWKITFKDYEEPQAIADGDPIPEGDSVELNASNDWSYTWHNLDSINGEVYFIKEIYVPDGYEVSYNNNDGISKGEIVVTNKKKTKEQDYILPETGGPGTNGYTAGGLAIMLAAGLVYRKKKKVKKGDHSLSN